MRTRALTGYNLPEIVDTGSDEDTSFGSNGGIKAIDDVFIFKNTRIPRHIRSKIKY
jgi:hypothetical protein